MGRCRFRAQFAAGGAGLVPWALITGYGTADSWGANAHYTAVQLRDFRLRSYGVAVGALDRIEISATRDVISRSSDGARVSR